MQDFLESVPQSLGVPIIFILKLYTEISNIQKQHKQFEYLKNNIYV